MNLAALLIPPSLDAKQALRLRRFGLAALSYALATALVAVAWTFGVLPASAALQVAAAFLALNLGLYVVIRSGFNLRFEDPSLTRFQILAAITVLMFIVYHMDDGRTIALFGCFIVFLFGVFRLNVREFTVVTLYTLAAYAVVINLLMRLRPQAIHDVPGEWGSWLALAGLLPCFAFIGGQINTLRRKLRESEARFRSLTEISSDFYWESDTEHRLTQRASADRKLSTVSVFQQGAQIGERRWEIPYLSPDEAGWQAHRAVLDAHRLFRDFELSRLGSDGTERHISISGDPVFDAFGAFKGYRGVGTDITERKRREQDLRHFRTAMDASADAIYLVDRASMRFVDVNEAACRMQSLTHEELLALGPDGVLSVPREELERSYDSIIAGGPGAEPVEMLRRRKDGTQVWVELRRRAQRSGESWLIVTAVRDITERKRAEQALQQQHARLLETERELLNAHESLAEADRLESVGRLAAGVAHEVKNPLTIIRLGTDYLAKQFSQESNQEVFDDVKAAMDRADNVITDLLDFSRQKPFAPRPTNIDEVIDNAIHLIRYEIDRRNIVIIGNRDDLMAPIFADPDRLVQVFINLLTNAAQAIGRDGSIEIVTRSICLSERDLEQAETSMLRIGEPVISVDIRDSGPGIAAEHEKMLFEPFFTTKPVGEGSGLGLAVSRSIVIMHRGSIRISNRPEGGASALLMFRVDREHLANEKTNTGSG
jgi:PAS domain S-box-containing protein